MCDCERALELLSARLDGALTDDESAELNEHLTNCPECAAAAFELEALHGLMPELLEEVPPGFHSRLMVRVAAEKVIPFPAGQRRTLRTLLSTAAVFAVLILGGSSLLHLGANAPQAAIPAPAALNVAPGEGAAVEVEVYSAGDTGGEERGYYGEIGGKTAEVKDRLSEPAPQIAGFTEGTANNIHTAVALTEEAASLLVAGAQWPGETVVALDTSDVFAGLEIGEGEAARLLLPLGLTLDGVYFEFSLRPEEGGEELERFAVPTDGTAILIQSEDPVTYSAVVVGD